MQLTLATQTGTFAITRRYRDKQYNYQVIKYINDKTIVIAVSKTIKDALVKLDQSTTP